MQCVSTRRLYWRLYISLDHHYTTRKIVQTHCMMRRAFLGKRLHHYNFYTESGRRKRWSVVSTDYFPFDVCIVANSFAGIKRRILYVGQNTIRAIDSDIKVNYSRIHATLSTMSVNCAPLIHHHLHHTSNQVRRVTGLKLHHFHHNYHHFTHQHFSCTTIYTTTPFTPKQHSGTTTIYTTTVLKHHYLHQWRANMGRSWPSVSRSARNGGGEKAAGANP